MKPLTIHCATLAVLTTLSLSDGISAGEPLDFKPVPGFFKLPDSITLDTCSGVAINSEGDIYLLHRGKRPIICFDAHGNYLRSWGDDLIGKPHGLRIDGSDNVWATDTDNHQVFKFSPTGKLLMALGKAGTPGNGIDEFNMPTDVAFGPAGEIYVTDGYGNRRIMKLTPNGGFLGSWGEPGDEPGQFENPHAIVVDSNGRIVVADRDNDRIQIFDDAGKLLDIWPGFAPYGLAYDHKGNLFVADGRANKVLLLNDQGEVIRTWGEKGTQPGQFHTPHMLATDSTGNLYIADARGNRLQKLARKP